jgi:glycogen debranching enzyme
MIPQYHKEARDTILYFAKVSRHGLIPNLHDMGRNTRFNARDATWFFLQSIKDYVQMASEGVDFLKQKFTKVFYSDIHTEHLKALKSKRVPIEMTIGELIQEILQKHAEGIHFREWNAGIKIDEHMKDEGFIVKIKLDPTTGFVVGGNIHNCGTWMDKMGSAPSNKGVPATPRDGAPIELTGLCYSVVSWLCELYKEGKFDKEGVYVSKKNFYTYESWAEILKSSFERCYWVPNDPTEDFSYG